MTGKNGAKRRLTAALATLALTSVWVADPAHAVGFVPLSVAGSTAAENVMDTWAAEDAASGLHMSYSGVGENTGATDFSGSLVDAAVVDADYGDGGAGFTTARPHVLVPITAAAIVMAYHLTGTDGKPVTGLRLSPGLVAKIFNRTVTAWNDPRIAAENPGVALPSTGIAPVVRSDAAATSERVGRWLAQAAPGDWSALCTAAGLPAGCAPGQIFPAVPGTIGAAGATGAAGYVAQSYGEGAITFVEADYAMFDKLSTAWVANSGGYYRPPTSANVAVALQSATVDTTGAVDLDAVAAGSDPEAYPLVDVSYLMAPTQTGPYFTADKGTTLVTYTQTAVCTQQNVAGQLGGVPLTGNLINGALGTLGQIPRGAAVPAPTVCTNLGDTLATTATAPAPGDKVLIPPVVPANGYALSLTLPPGALILSVPGTNTVVMPSPVLDGSGTFLASSGPMAPLVITDDRAGAPGWSLTAQASAFSDATGASPSTFSSAGLGWTPTVLSAQGPTVTAGPLVDPDLSTGNGGLATPRVLATSTGVGTARVGAELELMVPTTVVAGTYSSSLVITAI